MSLSRTENPCCSHAPIRSFINIIFIPRVFLSVFLGCPLWNFSVESFGFRCELGVSPGVRSWSVWICHQSVMQFELKTTHPTLHESKSRILKTERSTNFESRVVWTQYTSTLSCRKIVTCVYWRISMQMQMQIQKIRTLNEILLLWVVQNTLAKKRKIKKVTIKQGSVLNKVPQSHEENKTHYDMTPLLNITFLLILIK